MDAYKSCSGRVLLIKVEINEIKDRCHAPMPKQTRLDVLKLERCSISKDTISHLTSRCLVHVLPSQEDLQIALHT